MRSATQSYGSMWRKQTHTVCFHNLLVDHLRPSEQAGLQRNRDRKPGPTTKLRTETGPVSPHKVSPPWKYMTSGSVDTICISSGHVCGTEAFSARVRLLRNRNCFICSRGPTRVDPADQESVGRSGGLRRAGVTPKNQDVTTKRDGKGAGCPANVRRL